MNCILVAALFALAAARSKAERRVIVRFRDVRSPSAGDDVANPLPETFSVKLERVTGHDATVDPIKGLDLVKNEKIGLMKFIVDGKPAKPSFNDVGFYQDRAQHAVITAKLVRRGANMVRTLRGSFVRDGVSYEVEPLDPDPEEEAKRDVDYDGHYHVVRQVSDHTKGMSTVFPKQVEVVNVSRRAGDRYDVEMFWVSDYQFWLEWKKISGHDLGNLKEWFAHQANGVDIVYTSITGFTINVWVLRVDIKRTKTNLPTDQSILSGQFNAKNQNKQSIDASSVLEKMGTYRKAMGYTWYKPDHLMMFTGFDLKGDTVGLAYLCRVCQAESGVSTVEYVGWHTWTVAAHELGHNLGMDHDAEKGNACPDQGNIMSPVVVQLHTLADVGISYKFSPCSIQHARECIEGTNDDKFPRICLQSGTCNNKFTVIPKQLPGEIDDLTKQCEEQYGPNTFPSGPCGSGEPSPETCVVLKCQVGNRCHYGRAADGSPCGGSKWCIEGKCVSNTKQPTQVYHTCSKGSSLPKVPAGCTDTSSDCPTLFKNPGINCIHEYFKKVCCKTCTAYGLA